MILPNLSEFASNGLWLCPYVARADYTSPTNTLPYSMKGRLKYQIVRSTEGNTSTKQKSQASFSRLLVKSDMHSGT